MLLFDDGAPSRGPLWYWLMDPNVQPARKLRATRLPSRKPIRGSYN